MEQAKPGVDARPSGPVSSPGIVAKHYQNCRGGRVSRNTQVWFEGLRAPVLLDGCAELLAPMGHIIPRWPYEVTTDECGADPCVVVSSEGEDRFRCVTLSSCGESRTYDTVNTICDIIVELSWELLRSGQWLMCLHGAAIEIAGRLVVIPNVRTRRQEHPHGVPRPTRPSRVQRRFLLLSG